MSVGPIQLIAYEFENFDLRGEVISELRELNEAGTIRLIDAQFIRKDLTGRLINMEFSGISEAEFMEFGAIIGGLLGLKEEEKGQAGSIMGALAATERSYGMSPAEIQAVADQVAPGGAAALILIEHTWATGFRNAMIKSGGKMLAQGFLTPQALFMVGAEVEAQSEAARAISQSSTIQEQAEYEAMEAVNKANAIREQAEADAQSAVALSNSIKLKAVQDAARAVELSDAIKKKVVDEAADALVTASLIEESAAEQVASVLAKAMAVEEAAVEEASEVVRSAIELRETVEDDEETLEPPTQVAHSLSYVEGIGPSYGKSLKDAGIHSTAELLAEGATTQGRAKLAKETGISSKLILKWINHVDLMRIRGIGSEYADLLEAAGVDTVPELAQRKPENLHNKLVEINHSKKLVRNTPGLAKVKEWVQQAKELPRIITY